MRRSRLDLPEPLGPVSTSAPLGGRTKSSPAKTSRPPRRHCRERPSKSAMKRNASSGKGRPSPQAENAQAENAMAGGIADRPDSAPAATIGTTPSPQAPAENVLPRSEEHTSELKSLMHISYAVFCLKQKQT